MAYGNNISDNIGSYVNNIHEAAMLIAREQNFITSLVTTFPDGNSGTAARDRSEYGTASFNQISDADDLNSQAFTPTVANTLTPGMFAGQFWMSDQRVRTDPFGVMADAARELGEAAGKKVQKDVLATFSSLTGGTAGSAGGTVTWGQLFKAVTLLRQQQAPGPYFGVISAGHWYHLGTVAVPAGAATNAPDIQNEIARARFVGSFFGVLWFETADIVSGTASVSAVFNRQGIAFDSRVPFNIRPQRDESKGGGGTELNADMTYAAGVWRPKFGVQIIGTDIVP